MPYTFWQKLIYCSKLIGLILYSLKLNRFLRHHLIPVTVPIGFVWAEDITQPIIQLDNKYIQWFILLPNSIAYLISDDDPIYCSEANYKLRDNSLLELNIDGVNLSEPTVYLYGLVKALSMGHQLKNCNLCKYVAQRYTMGKRLFCYLSKKYNTPKHPKQNFANNCKYYTLNKTLINDTYNQLSASNVIKIDSPSSPPQVCPM